MVDVGVVFVPQTYSERLAAMCLSTCIFNKTMVFHCLIYSFTALVAHSI